MRAGHCPIHPAGMIDLRSQLADLLEERDGSGGRVILSLLTAHPKLLLLHLHTERGLANVLKFFTTPRSVLIHLGNYPLLASITAALAL